MNRPTIISRACGLLFLASILFGGTACEQSLLETVETGEIFLPEQDPKYKFTRNQESSVDIQEAEIVTSTLRELQERFLDEAQIRTADLLNTANALYDDGLYGYAPAKYTAQSEAYSAAAMSIKADIKALIESTARISGLGSPNPIQHRRREAEPNLSGYIGTSSSAKLTFVDEHGLVVTNAFKGFVLGAIYLDQILNVHLDEGVISNQGLIADHENQVLYNGTNYTALEHHWDLAYGYYLHGLRSMASGNGIVALRGVARRLDLAFTLGRIDINYHLYDKLQEHTQTIRRELARILLIRLEHLLIGGNTLANLNEEAVFAFPMLSEAYGLLYALPFLRNPEGKPYFTLTEVKDLQARLLGDRGFWAKDRLVSKGAEAGTLRDIVKIIKDRVQISQ